MKLSKELYDKVCVWMADHEDPSTLMEDGVIRPEDYEQYMIEQAFDIMYAVYSAHVTEMVLEEEIEN